MQRVICVSRSCGTWRMYVWSSESARWKNNTRCLHGSSFKCVLFGGARRVEWTALDTTSVRMRNAIRIFYLLRAHNRIFINFAKLNTVLWNIISLIHYAKHPVLLPTLCIVIIIISEAGGGSAKWFAYWVVRLRERRVACMENIILAVYRTYNFPAFAQHKLS